MKVIAKQQDSYLRAQFAYDVTQYQPEMLVFLDETGSDKRDSLRKYGYSLQGRPAKSKKTLNTWKASLQLLSCPPMDYLISSF